MKNLTTPAVKILLGLFFLIAIQQNSFAVLYQVNASMSGAQEVPPNAGGSGTFTGIYNSVTKVISYKITFSVTGTTTAGHFHGPALAGVNAGVRVAFTAVPLGVTSGSFSESKTLTAANETELLGGLWYANIHTSTFSGGAIRGQLNPVALRTLDLTYLIQGLYNNVSNTMVGDTVSVVLRSTASPYPVVDSVRTFLNTSGKSLFGFLNAANATPYYIQMLHRNAVETYSGAPFSFTSNSGSYDFTNVISQALGDNLIQKGSKFCSFSGDVNQDGFIELSDVVDVFNDNTDFVTGYVNTDLNGDNQVTLEDLLICFNNSSIFVKAIVPTP